MGERVRLVDTTLRDGQMSLWATNLRTGMILPIAAALDGAGFDAAEIMGSAFFKKCVRDLHDDPWERMRLVSARMPNTPLRVIKTRHIATFQVAPTPVAQLWLERLAANGVRQVRMSDPTNTVANLKEQVRMAAAAGLESIVNLIYSVSPKHTDEYYAERAHALGDVPAMRLCLKDPGGLLTPERTRTLTRTLMRAAAGRPLEIHTHCNTGLGPLCCLEALNEGVRIVNTAIPPLANGASLPSVFNFVENATTLGYEVDIDLERLRPVERHFRRIAQRDGFPEGVPAEYDEFHYQHQVPGGMISNFRYQLDKLGMGARLGEVLAEIVRIREELGYPIMVTPYSQYVGSQAFINVVVGERYREVTDDLIHYALGHWGREEADAIAPDVKDRLLGRSRAKELAAEPEGDVTLASLRRRLDAGPSVDDDELLLRYLVGNSDVDQLRRSGPPVEDTADEPSLLALVRGICSSRRFGSIQVQQGDIKLTVARSQNA